MIWFNFNSSPTCIYIAQGIDFQGPRIGRCSSRPAEETVSLPSTWAASSPPTWDPSNSITTDNLRRLPSPTTDSRVRHLIPIRLSDPTNLPFAFIDWFLVVASPSQEVTRFISQHTDPWKIGLQNKMGHGSLLMVLLLYHPIQTHARASLKFIIKIFPWMPINP